jgi:hypothetical protein
MFLFIAQKNDHNFEIGIGHGHIPLTTPKYQFSL